MKVTLNDVEHIEKLARLELAPGEKELYRGQMENILALMDELKQLDTSGVEPTAHALGIQNVLRDDSPEQFPGREAILKNAPAREYDLFKVKKVIE